MTCFYLCWKLKPRPEEKIPCHSSLFNGIIAVHIGDHLRFGIICGPIWRSFAVWGSFAALYSTLSSRADRTRATTAGTFPCHRPRCHTCDFRERTAMVTNASGDVRLKGRFDCTVAGVVYVITCQHCYKLYIGETDRKLACSAGSFGGFHLSSVQPPFWIRWRLRELGREWENVGGGGGGEGLSIHYQSNRKSNVSAVLEKDESFKLGTFHQDLSHHSNEMMPCPILHKTDLFATRDNLGNTTSGSGTWHSCLNEGKIVTKSIRAFSRKLRVIFKVSKYNKNKVVLNVIANYVHKTWINGVLVLKESSNI